MEKYIHYIIDGLAKHELVYVTKDYEFYNYSLNYESILSHIIVPFHLKTSDATDELSKPYEDLLDQSTIKAEYEIHDWIPFLKIIEGDHKLTIEAIYANYALFTSKNKEIIEIVLDIYLL